MIPPINPYFGLDFFPPKQNSVFRLNPFNHSPVLVFHCTTKICNFHLMYYSAFLPSSRNCWPTLCANLNPASGRSLYAARRTPPQLTHLKKCFMCPPLPPLIQIDLRHSPSLLPRHVACPYQPPIWILAKSLFILSPYLE
jgi:hypothetical protein